MGKGYNCSSSCTSASVIIGGKTALNMVHSTDITGKGKNPPSWEVSRHTLQCQGQFVVVENRQMSDGKHNKYLSVSEASNSSTFTTDTYGLCRSDNVIMLHTSIDTLLSYKEISSCREIQQELMQYGSICEYIYSVECSSSIGKYSDDSLSSGIGDIIPKGNASVPVPNTQQHSVHKHILV